MARTDLPKLDVIVGEQLSAVTFVQDYVQFHFDGPALTAIANPAVTLGDVTVSFPDAGSRDALCALIAKKVTDVSVSPTAGIQIRFASGHALTVPVVAEGLPEAATFSDPAVSGLLVW